MHRPLEFTFDFGALLRRRAARRRRHRPHCPVGPPSIRCASTLFNSRTGRISLQCGQQAAEPTRESRHLQSVSRLSLVGTALRAWTAGDWFRHSADGLVTPSGVWYMPYRLREQSNLDGEYGA